MRFRSALPNFDGGSQGVGLFSQLFKPNFNSVFMPSAKPEQKANIRESETNPPIQSAPKIEGKSSLFGNAEKTPATSLFGNMPKSNGGLFGPASSNSNSLFSFADNKNGGSLFGNNLTKSADDNR